MSAAELLDALTRAGCDIVAVGGELEYDDPPEELAAIVDVLQTGIRAKLAGRTWWGCDCKTGKVFALNTRELIPANVGLLCVEGDDRWDRLHPAVFLDLPELFADTKRRYHPGATTSRRVYS